MDETIVKKEPVIEAPTPTEEVTEVAALPGEKTESAKLLESLQEERRKRRELEAELALKTAPAEGYVSDEAKALKAEIDRMASQLEASQRTSKLSAIQEEHPALKDKASEFEVYLEDNKGMKLETAAKAFLVENDLIETPKRKGLERDTGGGRVPVKTGRTEEEVAELRKNNWRQWEREVKKGTLWTG